MHYSSCLIYIYEYLYVTSGTSKVNDDKSALQDNLY